MIKSFLLFLCLIAAPGSFAFEKGKTYKITVLHDNDHHGHFWKNKDGEYGMAARYTLVQRIRAEVKKKGGQVLYFSGGDVNTGVPESDLLKAEPDFKAMNKLGYDAMALGNHEFDNPLYVLREQQDWANFPFLSANVFYKNSKENPFLPYILKSVNGLQVAIVGMTTEDTPILSNPKNMENIVVEKPSKVAMTLIPNLKKISDIVIAVTHMGHHNNGEHGTEGEDDVTLARSVSGIHLIVGGHTHKPLFKPDVQNSTIIVQAHEWGKHLGRVDLEFKDGKVSLVSSRLIPVNLKEEKKNAKGESVKVLIEKEIPEDKGMLAFLEPFQKAGEEKLALEVGETIGKFQGDREVVRQQETNLGKLLAHVYKELTSADLAVVNSGGIRTSLPEGKISVRDIRSVVPFMNTVCSVVLKGQELREFLQAIVNRPKGSGGFPQFTGVDMVTKDGVLTEVRIAGKDLEANQEYKLALNQFMAAGGDGYPKLVGRPQYIDTGYPDFKVVMDYVKTHSPLKAKDFEPGPAVKRL